MASIKGWLSVGKEPLQLVARGRLYSICQHFAPQTKGYAACVAPRACVLCELGLPVQQIAAIPVSEPCSETIYLLRLVESQKAMIGSLQTRGDSLIGAGLWVERIPDDTYRRLSVRITGQSEARPVPCEKYIAAIGIAAYERLAELIISDPGRLW